MIRAVYDRGTHTVRVTGHAGYAEPGEDILCASVSILLHTLAAGVRGLWEQGLAEDVTVQLRSGDAVVQCVPAAGFGCVVLTVMDSILLGLDLLAAEYGEYVQIEKREGDE